MALTSCARTIEGRAAVEDRVGDASLALNSHGERPRSVPEGADLRRVALRADGGRLEIEFEATERIPASPIGGDPLRGPAWFLRLWNDRKTGKQTYIVGVAFIEQSSPDYVRGKRFSVVVCEGDRLCANEIGEAKVDVARNRMTVALPLSKLPKLSGQFTWVAGSFWNDVIDREFAWGDDVPDQPQSADKLVVRPEHRARFPQ